MFFRLASGRYFSGKESQVVRPMITAFCLAGFFVSVVIWAKCFISDRICHGIVPFLPIPRFLSVATMISKGRGRVVRGSLAVARRQRGI